MKMDDLTIGEVKELTRMFSAQKGQESHSFRLGKIVFIQTVTHYFSGRLMAVTDSDVVLEDAAWIADTGMFSDAMKAIDALIEVEPFPGSYVVCRGAIVGFCEPAWDVLPRSKK
jgi:hypothetical protein